MRSPGTPMKPEVLRRERRPLEIALANATGALTDDEPIDLGSFHELDQDTAALVICVLLSIIHNASGLVGPEAFEEVIAEIGRAVAVA